MMLAVLAESALRSLVLSQRPMRMPSVLLAPGSGLPPAKPMPTRACAFSGVGMVCADNGTAKNSASVNTNGFIFILE